MSYSIDVRVKNCVIFYEIKFFVKYKKKSLLNSIVFTMYVFTMEFNKLFFSLC